MAMFHTDLHVLFFSHFQHSEHPRWNTELVWNTQLSEGYLENTGHVEVGSEKWTVSQQFSYQDTPSMSEMVARAEVANRESNLEYKIDYLQRVSLSRSSLT
jgi:hypothetical protein